MIIGLSTSPLSDPSHHCMDGSLLQHCQCLVALVFLQLLVQRDALHLHRAHRGGQSVKLLVAFDFVEDVLDQSCPNGLVCVSKDSMGTVMDLLR